jgi:hypothetical protein
MTPKVRTILEPIAPHPGSFDARAMARAEPGVPRRFDWRGKTYVVVEVLETWRETEAPMGGSTDRYVRRHAARVRTESGETMLLSATRGVSDRAARWTLRAIEEEAG